MECPRCDGRLDTYAIEATGRSAVVCEDCGFAGVTATHESERANVESWDRAIERFERTGQSSDPDEETGRATAAPVPTDDSAPDIDPDALEESVAVATVLRGSDGTTDDDATG